MSCIAVFLRFLIFLSLIVTRRAERIYDFQGAGDGDRSTDNERIYGMRKCSGSGCPYAASWLAHINLFKALTWRINNTKMEAASFAIFDRAYHKYQLEDHTAFFVHHMSRFEHSIHRREGFEAAANKTLRMSLAAYEGECLNLTTPRKTTDYLAFIPFFSGRPPGVTSSLEVRSIGEGNSLVDPNTKSLQAMATICSCLKYFGQAVVGVSRDHDRELMMERLENLRFQDGTNARRYVHIVQLHLGRPAYLPFHLLVWGQQFFRDHNCKLPQAQSINSLEKKERPFYVICDNVPFRSIGTPVVTYFNESALSIERNSGSSVYPLKYAYFTESDQVVRFDSMATLRALTSASNESCFFVGRRKEKNSESSPEEYMKYLDGWRTCGASGYSLHWPKTIYVRKDPDRRKLKKNSSKKEAPKKKSESEKKKKTNFSAKKVKSVRALLKDSESGQER